MTRSAGECGAGGPSGRGYDIIGDIHGHADALHRLLRSLEYSESDSAFRHPERQMQYFPLTHVIVRFPVDPTPLACS